MCGFCDGDHAHNECAAVSVIQASEEYANVLSH